DIHVTGVQTCALPIFLDDTALPLGKIRIRQTGSNGGQNGLKDIINKLGTKDFKRLRIGIGEHAHMDKVDFVLGKFSTNELNTILPTIEYVHDAIIAWISTNNFNNIMTKYNTPQNHSSALYHVQKPSIIRQKIY